MNIDVEELMRPARDALRGLKLVNWQLRDIDGVILDTSKPEDQKLIDSIFNDSGGLIEYGGDLYVIYIPRGASYKFHVTECSKIKEMREKRRFFRYVLTRDTSGQFKIFPQDGKDYYEYAALDVCKYCLHNLRTASIQWTRKFVEMQKIFKNNFGGRFDIATFFKIYGGVNFKSAPAKTSSSAMLRDGYTDNWEEISRLVRENASWKCSECGVCLTDRRELLHVHHINGNKQDNDPSNLRPLCKICHKKMPAHERIVQITPEEYNYIIKARGY